MDPLLSSRWNRYCGYALALVVLPRVLVGLLLRRPGPVLAPVRSPRIPPKTYGGFPTQGIAQVALNDGQSKETGDAVRLPSNFTWQCPICAFQGRTDDEAMEHHENTMHPVTVVVVV